VPHSTPPRRPTPPPPPPRQTNGNLAAQAASLRPPEPEIAIGDSTLIELQKAAAPPTPPPEAAAPRVTGARAVPPVAPTLEPPRAMAPPPHQPLPAVLAGAIPYVFEVARSRRSLRRRRDLLVSEQAGDEQRLAEVFADLGAAVRKAGVKAPALEPLLASIAAAECRRDKALAAAAETRRLHQAEDAQLATREAEFTAEWEKADQRASDAEAILAETTGERLGVATALARLTEARKRLDGDADERAAVTAPRPAAAEARALAEGLRRQSVALATAEPPLQEQLSALDERLADLRKRAESLRGDASAKRARRDAVSEGRRQAGADVEGALAGHGREQADAERQSQDLTGQLGRAAARAKPFAPSLQDSYARLETVEETSDARQRTLDEIEHELLSFDERKLYAGIAMLAIAAAAALALIVKLVI
jgi:hypothetical protein